MLKAENETLRKRNRALETENKELRLKIDSLEKWMYQKERDKAEQKALCEAVELARMFIHYKWKSSPCKTWSVFKDKLAELEDDYEEPDLSTQLAKINPIPLPELNTLINMKSERNSLRHDDIRSAKAQKLFLESVKTVDWSVLETDFANLVSFMITTLDGMKLTRMS